MKNEYKGMTPAEIERENSLPMMPVVKQVQEAENLHLEESADMSSLQAVAVSQTTTDLFRRMYLCYKMGYLAAMRQGAAK